MLQPDAGRDRHTLMLPQVAQLLKDAGVPRSERRIAYFCQTQLADAGKYPSPTGPQWYVNPASLPGLIGDLKQFDEQKRRRLQHAAAASDSIDRAPNTNPVAASSSVLEPAAAGSQQSDTERLPKPDGGVMQPAASAYVTQLETRIGEKDEVIGMLRGELAQRNEEIVRRSERERETNILIRGLQNLVLRLQPGSTPSSDVLEDDTSMQRGGGVDNPAPIRDGVGV